MRLHHATWYLAALAAVGMPALAGAQGFGLNEIGSCAVSRGFANTSAPCRDASMIFWNPGAMTSLDGNSIIAGAAMIKINGAFVQDTSGVRHETTGGPEFPPHLFLSRHGAGSRFAYGLGVYVPYGLVAEWSDTFPGRFAAKHAGVQTVYVQPSVAYQFHPNWSIGAGLIVGHSSLELIQSVDFAEQVARINGTDTVRFSRLGIARGTEFARANLTGSGWGTGFNLGLKGRFSPVWEAGVRYLSKVGFDYEGDATFEQVNTGLVFQSTTPGTPFVAGAHFDTLTAVRSQFTTGRLTPQSVKTRITHPSQLQAGVTYTGFPNTSISAEYAWLGWKSFAELPINFTGSADTTTAPSRVLIEDYNNSSTLRLGVEHQLVNPGFTQGWALRVGGSAATSAAPPETVTPLLPEQDRYTFNLGAGIPVLSRFTLDAAYAYVGTWGARGRTTERPVRTLTAEQLNNGWFHLDAHIVSLSLKTTF